MNEIYLVGAVFLFLLIIVAIVSLIKLSDKDDDLQVAYGMVGLGIFGVGIIVAVFLVLVFLYF
ncbi:MAG TPA: hypothetical protein DHV77_06400 [Erysipelotrichaceae bacterium]|nr:hypothetical protein [Erysipelotrichaceae bacterium]